MKFTIKNSLAILILIIPVLSCNKDDDPVSPPVPVATEASDISNNEFTANWENSAGATEYELDVATDNGFVNIVGSEKNLGGSTFVSGLASNTEYFYRVRATINGANPSANSNTISVYTLPDRPLALGATNKNSSGFVANWEEVPGITTYLLYVSKDNFPANPPDNEPGYDGKEVTGTSHEVTGLDSGTFYYYVLKAKSGDRESTESNSISTGTSN